ncbi:LysR substrate-binding domain-containing protein [Paenalcaligenes niemegkensis]|uniref:LysR substrate-binding domain-containing protein n=1 Tax=Paenalcaligenes niemegkensis TaxID=2895469 RepID=UPI001EE9A78D|nr:LysR substrate-binding domain-containing protein [Paenalcaligenes niemegkensis]MCQ9617182.1 LysR substrate-binding domain-containing protein [Paenalcaligenes niemegkensis]
MIYDDVISALNGVKRVEQKAAAIAGDDIEPLRITATSAFICGIVARSLAALPSRSDRTLLRSAAPEQVVHEVISGAAHLGISSLPLDHSGVKLHWIASAPCVVAVPSDSPLAEQVLVSERDLNAYLPITMANPYRLRQRLQASLPAWFDSSALIETNSSVNALCAVKAGLGVAILEPFTCRGLELKGVSIRPLDIHIPFHFGVITLQDRQLSPMVKTVIESLKKRHRRSPAFSATRFLNIEKFCMSCTAMRYPTRCHNEYSSRSSCRSGLA